MFALALFCIIAAGVADVPELEFQEGTHSCTLVKDGEKISFLVRTLLPLSIISLIFRYHIEFRRLRQRAL
jgi:hypothetical protein